MGSFRVQRRQMGTAAPIPPWMRRGRSSRPQRAAENDSTLAGREVGGRGPSRLRSNLHGRERGGPPLPNGAASSMNVEATVPGPLGAAASRG
jgi:hypothetical protein